MVLKKPLIINLLLILIYSCGKPKLVPTREGEQELKKFQLNLEESKPLGNFQGKSVKNVILMIGDGMGKDHIKVTESFLFRGDRKLAFSSFPSKKFILTKSAGSFITDSAASATAMATGQKVLNGVLSLSGLSGGRPLTTILEVFKKCGMSTALITSTHLTNATPAAFATHVNTRSNYAEIALQYFRDSRPNLLLGGGGYGISRELAESNGHTFVSNKEDFVQVISNPPSHLVGAFGNGHLPYSSEKNNLPALWELVNHSLKHLLKDPNGFFLMVEGGRIDHASHKNDLENTIGEVAGFSKAVERVLSQVRTRKDTLVLVTADHETGGLQLIYPSQRPGQLPVVLWKTRGHSASPVPVFLWGPENDQWGKLKENTDIFNYLKSVRPCS
jgi:alkaline phosphatase